MPNNTPLGNLLFSSPIEALNALSYDPQLASLTVHGVPSQSFTASTLFGVSLDSGTLTVQDTSANVLYKFTGPLSQSFQPGWPLWKSPPGGACVAVLSATSSYASLVYK